jgi:hypothetical protein
MNIDAAFRSIYSRDPNAEETGRFNRIARELGIRDNDAIWAVVFLLGHHLELTQGMPERMEQLTAQSMEQFTGVLLRARKSAEAEFAATRARVEENVSQALITSVQKEIARSAQTVARDAARKSWLQWLGGAAVSGMILIGGAFYWGYVTGNATGYVRALGAKSISVWATTAMGQAAYELDQNDDLRALVRCNRDGWKIQTAEDGKHKICLVGAAPNGRIYGWYLP